MYNLKANFYPAKEPKNGYIGFADLTIANAIRIRGIAVFDNHDSPGHHIQFPGYEYNGHEGEYVIPASKEAYAAMLGVVEKAIEDKEQHFAWATGKMDPWLKVSGVPVIEPYADGRFSIEVEDLCTLRGITTRHVDYKNREGQDASFVSVDMPKLPAYEKDGEMVYPAVFEGLKYEREKDGKKDTKDYGLLIRNIVRNAREKLQEQHPSLDARVSDAEQRAAYTTDDKTAPVPEPMR